MSTPVYHDGYLLIGGLMMKLDQDKPNAVVLWPESRATAQRVLSDTSTPLFRDGYVYSARSFGEFVCLDAKTGKQLWETDKVTDRKSGASVHPTENGKSVLLYNDRGELIRAHGGWAVGAISGVGVSSTHPFSRTRRKTTVFRSRVFAVTARQCGRPPPRSPTSPKSGCQKNAAMNPRRRGHGRVGRVAEPDGPRHRCAHFVQDGHARQISRFDRLPLRSLLATMSDGRIAVCLRFAMRSSLVKRGTQCT